MTHQVSRPRGAVISYTPSRMPELLSFLITATIFLAAFLATFSGALAADGKSHYDRYALPWVKAYAPPNTAPGTYDRSHEGEYWRGSRNDY